MKNLKIVVILTSAILIAEVVGGVISGSLALLSDAGHVFMDLFAFSLTWFALKISAKPANSSQTFGYHRTEILAALVNGVTLLGICFFIFYEAYRRMILTPEVKSIPMLTFAFVGLAVNLWVVIKFKGYADLNLRSAFLHALGDLLGSIAVIFGAIYIAFTGQYIVDPILSIFIGGLILLFSFRLIRESMHVLLEGVPRGIDVDKVIDMLSSIQQVKGVHDVHIWSICSNARALSAHVLTEDLRVSQTERIKREADRVLEKLSITHVTIQFEHNECGEKKLCDIKHK